MPDLPSICLFTLGQSMPKYSLKEAMLDDRMDEQQQQQPSQGTVQQPVANQQQQQQGNKPIASDVKNVAQKMATSGVNQLLLKINTQQELEQFLGSIFMAFTGKLSPQVIRTAIQNAAKQSIRPK